jgi:hypothetical protein
MLPQFIRCRLRYIPFFHLFIIILFSSCFLLFLLLLFFLLADQIIFIYIHTFWDNKDMLLGPNVF